ncbi:MAG: flagellar basal body P-ring formation chaperone FlgA [Tabrizicola sp.]|uniref:flagellar basal body P-ring formation chaperone FlgA n=1 Tax=Tabrizicola sp. TaxID=2005166 RepID=UPI002AB89B29|nr:flagellar basal body P-ring formation chaperone FlgA [Tabrizicola sp.]MDZ4088333.1 flagellar basal body P-ring formation chaperone FlgA [Tabrizicola sp.]
MLRVLLLIALAAPVSAESLVATRTIRAKTLIAPEDLTLVNAELPGALTDPALAVGLEARVSIYAGKPVRLGDLGPPTLVERNQLVTLVYVSGGLAISTEGRALARGADGDQIRVMNLGSRNTVTGRIGPDGAVYVGWNG